MHEQQWWINPNQSLVKSVRHYILATKTVIRRSLFEMESVYLSDAQGLKPFDCSETSLSARWERWLRTFELFATGKESKMSKKKALLLHTAGSNVQEIYFTLTEEGVSDSYQKAKATLNKYFKLFKLFQTECSV